MRVSVDQPISGRRWRHVKRNTLYTEIGRGYMQSTDPEWEMKAVVIYESDADGTMWVRPATEFDDGRFVRAPD